MSHAQSNSVRDVWARNADMQVAIQVAKPTGLETKNIGLFTLVGEEAERIVRSAGQCGVTLRLIGGLAVQFHCHGEEERAVDLYCRSD